MVRFELCGLDHLGAVPSVGGAGGGRRDTVAQVDRLPFLERGALHVRCAQPVAFGRCPAHDHDVELVSVVRTLPSLVARGADAVLALDDQQVEIARRRHLAAGARAEQDDLVGGEALDDQAHGGVEAFGAGRCDRGCHRFPEVTTRVQRSPLAVVAFDGRRGARPAAAAVARLCEDLRGAASARSSPRPDVARIRLCLGALGAVPIGTRSGAWSMGGPSRWTETPVGQRRSAAVSQRMNTLTGRDADPTGVSAGPLAARRT